MNVVDTLEASGFENRFWLQIILFHPLHYHMLWLLDAVGHAASVASNLDLVEKDFIMRSKEYD